MTKTHTERLQETAEVLKRAVHERDARALVEASLEMGFKRRGRPSPRTVEAYSLALKSYFQFLDEYDIDFFTPHERVDERYVLYLGDAGFAANSIRQRISAVKTAYLASRRCGLTVATPFEFIDPELLEGLQNPTATRLPYTDDEMRLVYKNADVMNRLILALTAGLGLRVGEMLRLKWREVEGDSVSVRKFRKREGREVEKSLMPGFEEVWEDYKALHAPGKPQHDNGHRATSPEMVFPFSSSPTARYRIEKAFFQAGVRFRGFQAFRKSAGYRLVGEGVPLEYVARELGNKDLNAIHEEYSPKQGTT